MKKLTEYLQAIGAKHGWELLLHAGAVVLICWVPAQLLCLAFHFTFPGPDETLPFFETPLRAVTTAILLAPILETQMMRLIFYALGKFLRNELWMCAISGGIWGLLHLSSESWGTHAVWTFFVLGICFLRLQKESKQRATLIVTAIHAAFNGVSYVVFLALASSTR